MIFTWCQLSLELEVFRVSAERSAASRANLKAIRRDAGQQQRGLLFRIEHRVVLVAFIQCVIGAFHENLGPLDQRGGEKTGKSADQDFLKEGGVHPFFNSSDGAIEGTLCPRSRSYLNTGL